MNVIFRPNDQAQDMTYVYLLVFKLGFLTQVLATIGFFLVTFADKTLSKSCGCFKSFMHYFGWLIFLLAFFPLNFVWIIFASILRFNEYGKIIALHRSMNDIFYDYLDDEGSFAVDATDEQIAAGYMPVSGLFLQIWLVAFYVIFGLFVLSCMLCICCKGTNKTIDTLISCMRRWRCFQAPKLLSFWFTL